MSSEESQKFLEDIIKRVNAPKEKFRQRLEVLKRVCEKKGIDWKEIIGDDYTSEKPGVLRKAVTAVSLAAAGAVAGAVYHKEICYGITKVCEYISNLFRG